MPFRTIEISNPDHLGAGISFMTVKSAALKRRADIAFYVPSGIKAQKLPVVTLLHGVYGSHWAWLFKGGAHRVLDHLVHQEGLPPMMLAMPSDGLWGDGSAYLRHSNADYSAWIVEEVPEAASILVGNTAHSVHFICGLSMGGYGAMRLGALHPDRYQAISAHSSITSPDQMQGFVEETPEQLDLAEDRPLQVLACMRMNAHRLPPLRFDCGSDDPLLPHNRTLHEALRTSDIAHVYEEFPGSHDWSYWHEHLADSLRFFARHLPG